MRDISSSAAATGNGPGADALPPEPMQHRRLSAALEAVQAAVSVCRRVQLRSGVGERAKADCSPVTIADFASQAVVVRTLRAALGTVRLVAEEEPSVISTLGAGYIDAVVSAARNVWSDATAESVENAIAAGTAAPDPDGFWTLDPVDGTKGFLRNQQYAIALAYIERGRPTLGVLGCPNLACDPSDDPAGANGAGIICFAVEGRGAFEVSLDDPRAAPRRLVAAPLQAAAANLRICVSVESAHGNASGTAAVMERAGVPCEKVALDSQGKYAVVARGQADAYLRVPSSATYAEWIWDHAAGHIIATEAGCRVTDLAGRPLDFGRGRRLEANRGVLCASAAWHARLLGACAAGAGINP